MVVNRKLAVLMTVHDRKKTTLECLNNLYACHSPSGTEMDVYLMDDGSTDGTKEAVSDQYPQVLLLHGDGSLYWNKGMRECWKVALKKKYDFYLWLNDDTNLFENAVSELLEVYDQLSPLSIVVGQISDRIDLNLPTYGGRRGKDVIVPAGKIEKCEIMNGNAVLVPKAVIDKIGILSRMYRHKWGDFDYGITAIKKGVGLYCTRCFIGTCEKKNVIRNKWCNPQYPLKERVRCFFSPLGLPPIEYAYYSFRTKPLKEAILSSTRGNWRNFKLCLFPQK